MAGTRLVLDAEVDAGNRRHAKYELPGLERLLDGLRAEERPTLARGDPGYRTERVMAACGQDYLFKLVMRKGVKRLVRRWAVVLRRRVADKPGPKGRELKRGQLELPFTEVPTESGESYEYSVLVTSLERESLTTGQLYRDRADLENRLGELNSQWGWGGFRTRDLKRTQIVVRLTAPIYNWRSVFVRLLDSERQ